MPRAPSRYDDGRPMQEHLVEKLLRGKKRLENGCWVCTTSFQCGDRNYRQVMVRCYGKRFRQYIHRLSYEVFRGPIPEGLDVCHTCDNPPCWNPAHLFAGSRADNMQDMSAKGRGTIGETHPFAKLTEAQVLAMYEDLDAGMSQYNIAMKYGLHKRYANLVLTGRRWKHLYRQHRM